VAQASVSVLQTRRPMQNQDYKMTKQDANVKVYEQVEVSDQVAYLKPIAEMTSQEKTLAILKMRREWPQMQKEMRQMHDNRG